MKPTPKIVKYPNKTLTVPTIEWNFVAGNKSDLIDMVSNMEQLLQTKPDGVALAANQAGYNVRMFILRKDVAEKYSIPTTIINPKINSIGSDMSDEREGCLSFPGLYLSIKRHNVVSCDFYDIDGNKRIVILEDFDARIFQHECEHLDGKLYVDNLPKRERYQVLGKFKNRNF